MRSRARARASGRPEEFDALKASHGEEARRREDAESALEAHRDDLETRMQDLGRCGIAQGARPIYLSYLR